MRTRQRPVGIGDCAGLWIQVKKWSSQLKQKLSVDKFRTQASLGGRLYQLSDEAPRRERGNFDGSSFPWENLLAAHLQWPFIYLFIYCWSKFNLQISFYCCWFTSALTSFCRWLTPRWWGILPQNTSTIAARPWLVLVRKFSYFTNCREYFGRLIWKCYVRNKIL